MSKQHIIHFTGPINSSTCGNLINTCAKVLQPARALGRWLRRREETSNSPYAGDSQAGRAAPKTARRKKETER